MNIDIKDIKSPNLLGELLRHLCFIPKNETGCYSTFLLEDGFKKISTSSEEGKKICEILFNSKGKAIYEEEYSLDDEINEFKPRIFKKDDVTVAWYWDGDGTLYFKVDDKEIINFDCKKNYEWEWV